MNAIDRVREFWESHISNEIHLSGLEKRGSLDYFDRIHRERYRFLYYFPKILTFFLSLEAGKNLLEMGCGMGVDLAQFAQKGLTVTGIDLSSNAIDLARKNFDYKGLIADLRVGSIEELPFPENSFDFVYSFGVIHHTPNPTRAFAEAYRVLRPGGRAIFMVYHRWSLNNIAHLFLRYPFEAPRHRKDHCPYVFRYSRTELCDILAGYCQARITTEYLYGAGWGILAQLTPIFLHETVGRIIGWHLVAYCEK